jgi:hypothetical protein
MLGPDKVRQNIVMSRTIKSVLFELAAQDNRSMSNLIEHVMREFIARQIGYERYRHLETGRIREPGELRPNPDKIDGAFNAPRNRSNDR